jgi:hypothetical protein
VNVQQQTEARERLDAATPGPWLVTPDHPDIVMKPDEGHPDGWDGTMIARVPADEFGLVDEANAQFIAHAPTDLTAALDALDRVRALHTVEERCHYGSGEWSVTREEWESGGYDGDPEVFLICSHCGRIEMRESQGQSEFASYLDALWPCADIRAIEGTPE